MRPIIRLPSSARATTNSIAWRKSLNDGKRIAVYYGGSGCEHAHDQVVALASRLKAPVARTSRAKDFLGYENPFDVGMTGVFGLEAGYHALTQCDTLLLLGCDFAWRQFYPSGAKIIQVDIDGTHLGRRHPVDLGVVGDVKATIEALLPRIKQRTRTLRFSTTHSNACATRQRPKRKTRPPKAAPSIRNI